MWFNQLCSNKLNKYKSNKVIGVQVGSGKTELNRESTNLYWFDLIPMLLGSVIRSDSKFS